MPYTDVLPARAFALAAACLVLAGCNGVVSDKPWFTDAGGPVLRQGVWRIASDTNAKCVVREDQPLETWPECAMGLVVRERDLLGVNQTDNGTRWDPMLYVLAPNPLAPGDPAILQLGEAHEDGKIAYEYYWARVSSRDDHGQAVALQGWRVLCGPPASGAPQTLYDGMTADSRDCEATTREALQRAAKASETDDVADRFTAHWVRDGAR